MTEKIPVLYFDKPGSENTAEVLDCVKKRAGELGIDTILVASTSGATGLQAAKFLQAYNVIVVSHAYGLRGRNEQEMTPENHAAIEATGASILTCNHVFNGVNAAMRKKWNTYGVDDIVASVLRIFGQGMKVCVEMSLMAADAGLIKVGEPCLVTAGTGHGADTAVLLEPVNTGQFFDLKILEILAKPRLL